MAESGDRSIENAAGRYYPPLHGEPRCSPRALKLLEGGQTPRAKKELEALVPQLGGGDRDVAMVSVGVAEYNAKETDIAHRYLASLQDRFISLTRTPGTAPTICC